MVLDAGPTGEIFLGGSGFSSFRNNHQKGRAIWYDSLDLEMLEQKMVLY